MAYLVIFTGVPILKIETIEKYKVAARPTLVPYAPGLCHPFDQLGAATFLLKRVVCPDFFMEREDLSALDFRT